MTEEKRDLKQWLSVSKSFLVFHSEDNEKSICFRSLDRPVFYEFSELFARATMATFKNM